MGITVADVEHAWQGISPEGHAFAQLYTTYFAYRFEKLGEGKRAGPLWQCIVASQELQVRKDPEATFNYAIDLVMLPDSPEVEIEEVTIWLHGNGLSQLSDDRLASQLQAYVLTPPGEQLLARLSQFIDEPIPYDRIGSKQDLGNYPKCFRTFVSVLLGSTLPQLREKAQSMIHNPDFNRIIALYGTITDTAALASRLSAV